ncbi:MAG: M23 family metallopeptidase [Rikenellaceae bacterium]
MSRKRPNRVAQLRSRRSFWRNFWRAMLQMIVWSCVAVLYYLSLSLLYDTPYEHYMRLSSDKLRTECGALQQRLDSLEMAIDAIEGRDALLFRSMFESSPYSLEADYTSRASSLRESLMDVADGELYPLLESRCDDLEQSVLTLADSTEEMIVAIGRQGTKSRNIPAIQPVTNRHLTLLTASFGDCIHPFYKTLHPHYGVDYTVVEGTRVFATADGVVKSVSLSNSPSGKSILIDHGNGYESYYAHLSKVDTPTRRRVKRGDIIGASGNTGLSLVPHLHYEIRYNGEPINPINYFFMELSAEQSRRISQIAESGKQSFD